MYSFKKRIVQSKFIAVRRERGVGWGEGGREGSLDFKILCILTTSFEKGARGGVKRGEGQTKIQIFLFKLCISSTPVETNVPVTT